MVEDCNLSDLGFSGPRYKWNNKRDGKSNIQERLDRFLANDHWRDNFWQAKVDHLGFNSSDHRPILLNSSPEVSIGIISSKRFLFEPFWLKEDDFNRVIGEVWSVDGVSELVGNLKFKFSRCALRLEEWSKARFGNFGKQVEEKNREIERTLQVLWETGNHG